MPATPELGGRLRFEGGIEVVEKLIAHEQSETYSHVGIAGEVAIELNDETVDSHHHFKAGVESGVIVDSVDEVGTDEVGHNHFFNKTTHYQKKAFADHDSRCNGIFGHLREHIFGADHGACEQRREEGEIECVGEEVAAGSDVAAIDVDHVGYGSECEE